MSNFMNALQTKNEEKGVTSELTEGVFSGNPLKAMRHKRKKDFTKEDNTAADIMTLIGKFKVEALTFEEDVPFVSELQETMDTFTLPATSVWQCADFEEDCFDKTQQLNEFPVNPEFGEEEPELPSQSKTVRVRKSSSTRNSSTRNSRVRPVRAIADYEAFMSNMK